MNRFVAAFRTFWQVLNGADLIERPEEKPEVKPPAPPTERKDDTNKFEEGAVYTLVLLQREGRLVDFLQESIDAFEDAQIGAAVRRIHADCRKVIQTTFNVVPLRSEAEGESVILKTAHDSAEIRLSGNVPDAPPYKGVVRHKGWKSAGLHFPMRSGKVRPDIIQAAEVEIG